jgi:hypothetical protein
MLDRQALAIIGEQFGKTTTTTIYLKQNYYGLITKKRI